MGANLVRRLVKAGHECVVYSARPESGKALAGPGVVVATSLEEFVAKLSKPRAAWVMVPAAAAGGVIEKLGALMEPGDIVIDGGNSYYRDDVLRAKVLKARGIHFMDVGTSGGVFGLERGYCLMIGGEADAVRRLEPIFKSIAPGVESAPRTSGRQGAPAAAEHGYLHCGPNGAGHFVKMVHNGIEYGLMAAYAEGLNILKNADAGLRPHDSDAETAPLREPEAYQYKLDIGAIAEVWRRGSVVSSWLLDLTAQALAEDAELAGFSGRVSDSGEGRWTAMAAVDEGVPAPVLSAALFARFASRGNAGYADRVLSALRKQFGGHDEKK
jgi:6-phosphogluconate dehydrogenase